MKNRTVADWQKIYDILIREADAPASFKPHFVECCTDEGLTEWRFEGSLGFGGKIWLKQYTGELHVTCYPEQSNAKRRRIIARVNALLKDL